MLQEALTFLVPRLNQGSSGAAKAESSAGTVTKLLGVDGGQVQLPCAGYHDITPMGTGHC